MLRAFMTMLIESIKRHQLWNMMPWDPGENPDQVFVLHRGASLLHNFQSAAFFLGLRQSWKGASALDPAFCFAGAWWVLFTTHQKALAELQQQYAGAEVQLPGVGSQHVSSLSRQGQRRCTAMQQDRCPPFLWLSDNLAAVFGTSHCLCQGWHGILVH